MPENIPYRQNLLQNDWSIAAMKQKTSLMADAFNWDVVLLLFMILRTLHYITLHYITVIQGQNIAISN